MSAHGAWAAFRYLWRRSATNRVKTSMARARDPKYALGLGAGLAYLGLMAWITLRPSTGSALSALPSAAAAFAPLLLAVLALGWWASGRTHMALAFTRPEAQFLFQAPIDRETLLRYKLVRSQGSILPLAILFTLVAHRALPAPLLATFLSIWLLSTTVHLHQVAAGLIRASWSSQGRAGLRHHWMPIVAMVAAALALAWAFQPLGVAYETAEDMGEFLASVRLALDRPGAVAALLPFRVALGPIFAADVSDWLFRMVPGVGLMAAHYIWIVRIDSAFEEAAAAAGVELHEMTTAFKEGRLGLLHAAKNKRLPRPWFRLASTGHPAVAITWKGFTSFSRSVSLSQGAFFTGIFFAFWLALRVLASDPHAAAVTATVLPAILGAMALLLGPIFLRNDLRTDLARLEIIRTLPLSGGEIFAAEVCGSAASLTVVTAFFGVIAFAILQLGGLTTPTDWRPWAALASAAVLLPPISFIAMGIQNGLVVVFPGWAEYGPTKAPGIDQMGEMLISILITSVLMALAMLVPAMCGGAVAFRLFGYLGSWAAAPAALVALLVLIGECVLMTVLLGEAFDELDPSQEGLLN